MLQYVLLSKLLFYILIPANLVVFVNQQYTFYAWAMWYVGRCGVVVSTLAFGSIGHGFKSEHCLFSHHSA